MYEIPKRLLDELESAGFVVSKEEVSKEEGQYYLFKKCSPAGQDFSFYARGNTKEELCEYIHDVWGDYDVSEETMVWLDEFGHGKNGAPYKMEDVLNDIKCCERYICDAYEIVSNFKNPIIYKFYYSLQSFAISYCCLLNIEKETPRTFRVVVTNENGEKCGRYALNKEKIWRVKNTVYGRMHSLMVYVIASNNAEALAKAKHLFAEYLQEKIDVLQTQSLEGVNYEL